MSLSSIALPPYASELFVNRDEEIELVQRLIQQTSKGSADRPRTIVFRGERGSGKTWLALHLQRTILPAIRNVTPLLINFFPPLTQHSSQTNEWFTAMLSGVGHLELDRLTRQIIEWVAERVEATTAPDASLRELTSWLARDVESRFAERVLVLILDSVYEADWDLLARLEMHLFAPLAALPHVVIVMTGRGRPYPWESPFLRVDVVDDHLDPFDTKRVEQQLKQQAPDAAPRADSIRELGGGHPLSNFLLAQTPDPSDSLEAVAEALLDVVQPREHRRYLRDYFEALCLLDGFREDEFRPMFAAYYNDPQYETWTLPHTREERDKLVETHLMHWEGGRFVIDEPLRLALESLVKRQPDLWRRLHCRAYRLYNEWGERFVKWREYYEQRASRHALALQQAGFDPRQCPNNSELYGDPAATGSGLSGRSA